MSAKSIFNSKFISNEIRIGELFLGGHQPIRIQSMCSTNTMDTKATVEQSIRMIEAGCELIRISAPGIKEAENLKIIKQQIRAAGYNTPLIADIHFNPKAAEIAATFVEKVRINPGNYYHSNKWVKNKFEYNSSIPELEEISNKLMPLLQICKDHGTAIRIGINHGSLSKRIINKYGNTPIGMLESALEFIEICEHFDFKKLVLSMKSSNLKIMVQAYRLLVDRMLKTDKKFPLHLGVTEAGNSIEGRIKSAAGIGTLINEGIGDTIRVSLTEDPEFEIPVAKQILKYSSKTNAHFFSANLNPFKYYKRKTNPIKDIGGKKQAVVISDKVSDQADFYFEDNTLIKNYSTDSYKFSVLNNIPPNKFHLDKIEKNNILVIPLNENSDTKQLLQTLTEDPEFNNPIIFKAEYNFLMREDTIIKSAIDLGSFFINGIGDGIYLGDKSKSGNIENVSAVILQSCGLRIFATEFIACPSCGRTQFNIQKAFEEVKKATSHLAGLKIGVMGCVVNGPGEMLDAHYGYVGAGNGKVNLYQQGELFSKGIPEDKAVNALISMIKQNGDWTDR